MSTTVDADSPQRSTPRTQSWSTAFTAVMLSGFAAYFISLYVQQVYLSEDVIPNQFFIANDGLTTLPKYLSGTYSFGVHFFGDYQIVLIQALQKSPYLTTVVQKGNYAPLIFDLVHLWAKVVPYKLGFGIFEILTALACLIPLLVWLPSKDPWSRLRDTIIIGLLSYPVLSVLDRGNFEGLVAGLTAGGVWAYTRKRYWLASFLIFGASSIKFYPIVFLLLLLIDRRWREVLTGMALSAAGVFGGLVFFGGGYGANLRAMIHNVAVFGSANHSFLNAVYFNRSLFGMFTVIHYWMSGSVQLQGLAVAHYSIIELVLALAFIAAAFQVRSLELWQRVLLITIVITALPETAGGYTYVVLLLPVALFLREPRPTWQFVVYGVPLALALVPMGIGIGPYPISGLLPGLEITWQNVVGPGLLLYLGLATVVECAWRMRALSPRLPPSLQSYLERSRIETQPS